MSDMKNRFGIPPFEYFDNKNIFSGNQGAFNYKIWPKEELKIAVWYGKNCYEKSEIAAEQSFEKSESGLQELLLWTETRYQKWRNGN